MNANVQFFSNPQFGNIRTLEINNKMWFGATDVATALGYSNPQEAIRNHCKSAGVREMRTPTKGGMQNVKFVNEGNVYRLVAKSELPKAEEFESWIFDEVIPSVIHTGGYIATKVEDTPEMIMARALQVAQITIDNHKQRVRILESENQLQSEQLKLAAPKIQCYNDYISSSGTYTTTQIAKEYGWGAETLNRKLKEMGVQYKQNGQWLLTAKYDGKGYTKSVPRTYTKLDGSTGTQMQTVWTSKGREFIHSVFKVSC